MQAIQLILTKVQLVKFNISWDPMKSLTCDDKNKAINMMKYRKILEFPLVHTNQRNLNEYELNCYLFNYFVRKIEELSSKSI